MSEQGKSDLNFGTVLTREDVDRLSGGTRKTMRSFTIPDSVTRIDVYAFVDCYCLITIVKPRSHVEAYCKRNNIRYSYGA